MDGSPLPEVEEDLEATSCDLCGKLLLVPKEAKTLHERSIVDVLCDPCALLEGAVEPEDVIEKQSTQ